MDREALRRCIRKSWAMNWTSLARSGRDLSGRCIWSLAAGFGLALGPPSTTDIRGIRDAHCTELAANRSGPQIEGRGTM